MSTQANINQLNAIGWVINLTPCRHLDNPEEPEKHVYALNIVMPCASKDGNSWPWSVGYGRGPKITGSDAAGRFSDFLFPWKWTWKERSWTVFGRKNNAWKKVGDSRPLSSGVPEFAKDQRTKIQGDMEKEIRKRIADSDYAFSMDPQDLGNPDNGGSAASTKVVGQSLAHAFAPATHLVAILSNRLLNLSGFLSINNGELDGYDAFVCFPTFKIGNTSFEPKSPVQTDPARKEISAKYNEKVDHTNVEFFCNIRATPTHGKNGEKDAIFALAATDSNRFRKRSESQKCRQQALKCAVDYLQPLKAQLLCSQEVVSRLANPEPGDSKGGVGNQHTGTFPYDKWLEKLAEALSYGWTRSYVGARGQKRQLHVLDYVTNQQMLESIFGGKLAAIFPPGEVLDDNDTRTLLGQIETYLPVNNPIASACRNLVEDTSDGNPDVMKFLRSWRIVAEAMTAPDTFADFYSVCWRFLWLGKVKSEQKPALNDLMKKVPQLLSADVRERIALGVIERINTTCGDGDIWKLLNDFVEGFQSDSDKNPAKPGIVKWLEKATHCDSTELGNVYAAFAGAYKREIEPRAVVPKDNGIEIVFDLAPDGNTARSKLDEHMRGYAIALRSGIKILSAGTAQSTLLWDDDRAQWITNTAVSYKGKDGNPQLVSRDEHTAWSSATVGSSSSGGWRTVAVTYEGAPLCSVRMDKNGKLEDRDTDFDATECLAYRWPTEDAEPPLLGYGQLYKADFTALDNAGGVVEKHARDPRNLAQVCAASDFLNRPSAEPFLYQSHEAPGAPTIDKPLPSDAVALSDETRAHSFVSSLGDKCPSPVSVALLAHDQKVGAMNLFKDAAYRDYQFIIRPPGSHSEFIRRWLATDRLLKEIALRDQGVDTADINRYLSDEILQSDTAKPAAIADFIESVTRSIEKPDLRTGPVHYHPAVSAIGVAAWFDGAFDPQKPSDSMVIPIDRLEIDGAHLKPASPTINFIVTSWQSESNSEQEVNHLIKDDGGKGKGAIYKLMLKRGSFARLRFYSLVDSRFFGDDKNDPSLHRFCDALGKDPGTSDVGLKFSLEHVNYRAFGTLELWFEVAPRWNGMQGDSNPYVKNDFVQLAMSPPTRLDPAMVQLAASGSVPPDWLRGLSVRRDEWHWTGYPVELPGPPEDLSCWLPAFAGTEAYRESFVHVFGTRTVTDPDDRRTDWRLGTSDENGKWTDLVHSRRLTDAERPARYSAYVARPLVRFRSWLSNFPATADTPLRLEQSVFATGAVLNGIASENVADRLPTPRVFNPIPLTATYENDANKSKTLPRRKPNGSLLVIMEPIRRTDDLAHTGGVGDTLEFDLLETRRLDQNGWLREAGRNPVFHPAPLGTVEDVRSGQPRFRCGTTFGLTYDIVRNAAVAQTAVVIHPADESRDWLMARGRLRRIVLPETLLNNLLQPPDSADQVANQTKSWKLPVRVEGTDRVPLDFCLDCPGATLPAKLSLVWGQDADGRIDLNLPEVHADGQGPKPKVRLLCSWHKARWQGGGESTWRVQILAQKRRTGFMEWETIARRSCFDQPDWDIKTAITGGLRIDATFPAEVPPEISCTRLTISDYSDPFWMLFVGTFGGKGELARADEYSLLIRSQAGENPKLLLRGESVGQLQPPPTKPDHWDRESPEFHLLLVFQPLTSISQGEPDISAGRLLAVFEPSDETDGEFVSLGNDITEKSSLGGCYAYLCAFQLITSASKDEPKRQDGTGSVQGERSVAIDSWHKLVTAMFPDVDLPTTEQGYYTESLVRPLPKFLGPIRIDSPDVNA